MERRIYCKQTRQRSVQLDEERWRSREVKTLAPSKQRGDSTLRKWFVHKAEAHFCCWKWLLQSSSNCWCELETVDGHVSWKPNQTGRWIPDCNQQSFRTARAVSNRFETRWMKQRFTCWKGQQGKSNETSRELTNEVWSNANKTKNSVQRRNFNFDVKKSTEQPFQQNLLIHFG